MFMALDKMPAAGDYGTLLAQFLPLVVLIVVFYFVLIRPQRKRDKQERVAGRAQDHQRFHRLHGRYQQPGSRRSIRLLLH